MIFQATCFPPVVEVIVNVWEKKSMWSLCLLIKCHCEVVFDCCIMWSSKRLLICIAHYEVIIMSNIFGYVHPNKCLCRGAAMRTWDTFICTIFHVDLVKSAPCWYIVLIWPWEVEQHFLAQPKSEWIKSVLATVIQAGVCQSFSHGIGCHNFQFKEE